MTPHSLDHRTQDPKDYLCRHGKKYEEIPFDWVLRAFADAKDYVDYILPAPGLCPKCRAEIHEKTLVQPIGDSDAANWI